MCPQGRFLSDFEQTLIVGCRAVITTPGPPYLLESDHVPQYLRVAHVPQDLLAPVRPQQQALLVLQRKRHSFYAVAESEVKLEEHAGSRRVDWGRVSVLTFSRSFHFDLPL